MGIHFSLKGRQSRQLGNVSDMCGWAGSIYYFGSIGYLDERITLNDKGKNPSEYSICVWSWQECTVLRYWIDGVGKNLQRSAHLTFIEVWCCTSLWMYKITKYPRVHWCDHQVLHEVEHHICSTGSWWPWPFLSRAQMPFYNLYTFCSSVLHACNAHICVNIQCVSKLPWSQKSRK